MSDTRPLTIALSKGRILEQTLPLLEAAGVTLYEDVQKTRKLMVDGDIDGKPVRFLIIRAADVCTYVEQGAADIGVAGRDSLLEYHPHVFEPLDLGIGRCRLCVCGPKALVEAGPPERGSRIRVATKYDQLASDYYMSQGVQAEIIHLYGSMELAPLVGMAERIVDLVETGSTLKANGLIEEITLCDISSRLIVNPASFATRKVQIQPIIEKLRQAVNDRDKG
ncbi:ATP phosphoribosyltransferase [Mariprofundus ferrinatatus]|uniref:ATP phosphoribosyltransferase n=1 Tax=Mariprofundus ferrinatatus TaxID=1921087 RepID=A0A2K8L1N7_9PROT|nr:ATP phosphoribosyltransferase [Mariprofundus ferrinatatus]ATX81240.1 ATP phosphoribosyltransferase [Mariprofundus ferrinatatus]